MGAIAQASPADIARLELLVGPLPEAWSAFLRVAGAATGNLRLRGQHTEIGVSLAQDVLPLLERGRKKKASKGWELASGLAKRFMVGVPRGWCQDCGPVWLDTSGELSGLLDAGGMEPVVVQLDAGGECQHCCRMKVHAASHISHG